MFQDRFHWGFGIEDTFIGDPHPVTGKVLDEYELTDHYRLWKEDFDRIGTIGLDSVRWGIPWYRVQPEKNKWDWSFTDQVIPYIVQEKKLHLVLDLMHYGVPTWMKQAYLDPDYPQYVEAYTARVIERYHDKSFGAMHRVALAPCSPFSVSADLLRESAVLARQYGVRLHTHLCETKDEEAFMLAREGVRPLEYMENLGWTGDDVWFAHGIHFNDEELRVLAKTRTGVAHCPISNMKLSSGIARIPEMLSLGVPVGLAVDGSASNDGSSLMEELRISYLLHRLNSSKAAPSGYELLKMATRGSAAILGRSDDIGSLAVGKCCDLFLIDSRRLELVGACFDPKSVLATVGVRGAVDYTVVQGRVTVEQGHLVTVDEESLAREAEEKCRAYLNR